MSPPPGWYGSSASGPPQMDYFVAGGGQRQIEAVPQQKAAAPGAGRHHRLRRFDAPLGRLHRRHPPARYLDGGGRRLQPDPGAQLPGAGGIGHRGGRRIGVARPGFVSEAGAVVQVEAGGDFGGLPAADFGGLDAGGLLNFQVGAEAGGVVLPGEHQIAGADEAALPAHQRIEVLEHLQAVPGHLRVNGGGVVHPHGAGGAAGGAAAQRIPFQQQRIGHPPRRQVIQDAAPHNPAANDNDGRRFGHNPHSRRIAAANN